MVIGVYTEEYHKTSLWYVLFPPFFTILHISGWTVLGIERLLRIAEIR